MQRLAADTESDGFLHEATKLHCLCIEDVDTGETWSCADQPDFLPIKKGLELLLAADQVIFQNGIGHDVPLIKKLYGIVIPEEKIYDTLPGSRVSFPDLLERYDTKLLRQKKMPGKLSGLHGIESWGARFGDYKLENEDWTEWTPHMQQRCEGDTRILVKLFHHIHEEIAAQIELGADPVKAIENETGATWVCEDIRQNGFPFNKEAAVELYAKLSKRRSELEAELKSLFPPFKVKNGKPFLPKKDNAKLGYRKGILVQKWKMVEFNPTSRQHIERCLKDKYGWKPHLTTPSGQAKIDDDILAGLPFPEAKPLTELFMLEKRIGALAEGKNGWLVLERDGRIHGGINPSGAGKTSRASHASPNMSQVVGAEKPYGKECRQLFTAEKGMVYVGIDLEAIQARALAHYLFPFDDGAYVDVVLRPKPDDFHSYNQRLLGLDSRIKAKRWLYAKFFGAMAPMLGDIADPTLPPQKKRALGNQTIQRFSDNIVGMTDLEEAMEEAFADGWIKALDGRKLPLTQLRLVLCVLLQSAEACIAKRWLRTIRADKELYRAIRMHLWSHDEIGFSGKRDEAKDVSKEIIRLASEAGKYFGFRCPVGAEAKIGANWYECH